MMRRSAWKVAILLSLGASGCGPDGTAPSPAPAAPAPSRTISVDVRISAGSKPPVLTFEEMQSKKLYAVDLGQVRQAGKRALASFLEAAGDRGATDLRLTGSLPRNPDAPGNAVPLRLRGAEVLTIESLPFLCPASESRGRCLFIQRALWVIRSAASLKARWKELMPRSGDALHADFSRQMIVLLVEPTVPDFLAADALAVLANGAVTVTWSAHATGSIREGASWHALVLPARDEPLSGVLKLTGTGTGGEVTPAETIHLASTVYGR